MASLLLRSDALFVWTMKTGGSFVVEAMRRCDIPNVPLSPKHGRLDDYHQNAANASFVFANVRHPYYFLKSYWNYRSDCGRNPSWEPLGTEAHITAVLDRQCQSRDFRTFVKNYLDICPGFVSKMYMSCVQSPSRSADFVGRIETLRHDLVLALQLAGEVFDQSIIMGMPVIYPSAADGKLIDDCYYDDVCNSEREAMEQFGYTKNGYIPDFKIEL